MGKISNYTQVSASKLADKLVCDQEDSGVTSTKSVSIEQIGNAVNALQVRSDLDTQAQTIVSAINEIASYTPVYNNTASGSIATFDTSLALPLQDLQIEINAIQEGSGTPSPQNIRNIIGFTGANIQRFCKNFLSFNSVSLGGSNPRTTARIDIDTIPAGTYTISFTNSGTGTTLGVQLFEQSSGGTAVANFTTTGSYTFTLSTSAKSIYMFMTTQEYNDGKTISINDFQIELGTTATAYEAYNGTTYPISWQSEAGTVYGGSLNVTSGVLTVTWGGVDMSTLSWAYVSVDQRWRTYDLIGLAVLSYSNPTFKAEQWNTHAWSGATMGDIVCDGGGRVYCYTTDNVNSPEGLLVYQLATPTTYQLTPTQISAIVGTNNIFTDTNGNTSVMYACSLKDYIDSQ